MWCKRVITVLLLLADFIFMGANSNNYQDRGWFVLLIVAAISIVFIWAATEIHWLWSQLYDQGQAIRRGEITRKAAEEAGQNRL